MPIYEYICQDCGERFDALRSMRDADAPIACGHCQSVHTTRQLSVFFAQSGGRNSTTSPVSTASSGSGCGGCSGGSCASCGR